ncbi:MAG TPA: amidohydrolase family protein [Victivallales bacterium]|nr:amidohydrolase family protein [Victivallales bacterium]
MKKLITNANIFNGKQDIIYKGQYLIIVDNLINKIGNSSELDKKTFDTFDQVLDLKNKYLIPGLIDAHVHIASADVNINDDNKTETYIGIKSAVYLNETLYRGFTTVRDAGGADWGMEQAIDEGIIEGPRLFRSEKALSQTFGHGDVRYKTKNIYEGSVNSDSGTYIAVICDGVDGVRKAARDQLRKGAAQIKIMAAGGVASPTDKISNLQFSEEETKAIVEEAKNAGTYVMAHVYTPEGIIRCVKLGIRSIEHGNLINDEAAEVVKVNDAYVVPTLAIYDSVYKKGSEFGFPQHSMKKLEDVRKQCINGVKICRKHNLNIGFGTDLLGDLKSDQCNEFLLRSKAETLFETLNSATYVNSKLLNMEGKLGIISEGAYADLIVYNSNPLQDISVFTKPEESLKLIIKNGNIIKNSL